MQQSEMARLYLSDQKLETLSKGLRQIGVDAVNAIGKVVQKTCLAAGLELEKITVPIGVLLVIFESRPDALPQVSIFYVSCSVKKKIMFILILQFIDNMF